jgi:hypothetical protein
MAWIQSSDTAMWIPDEIVTHRQLIVAEDGVQQDRGSTLGR